jgi:hypothetical protein
MVAELGDMVKVLVGRIEGTWRTSTGPSIAVTFDHRKQAAEVSLDPTTHVVEVGVRGATHTLTTRLDLYPEALSQRSAAD